MLTYLRPYRIAFFPSFVPLDQQIRNAFAEIFPENLTTPADCRAALGGWVKKRPTSNGRQNAVSASLRSTSTFPRLEHNVVPRRALPNEVSFFESLRFRRPTMPPSFTRNDKISPREKFGGPTYVSRIFSARPPPRTHRERRRRVALAN